MILQNVADDERINVADAGVRVAVIDSRKDECLKVREVMVEVAEESAFKLAKSERSEKAD